jgi:hypothetical protein
MLDFRGHDSESITHPLPRGGTDFMPGEGAIH